jgi:hypothetical protein
VQVRNLGINVHEGMERELNHVNNRRVNACLNSKFGQVMSEF